MRVRTAGKLGYCFGVSQAIEKAIKFAGDHEGKLYTLGTLAHNEQVVEYLRSHGIEPVPFEKPHPSMPGNWAKLSHGNIAITAHGAPPEIYERLKEFNMNILDCTCPIVRKAQLVVSTKLDGFDIVIYGDPDHQEVIGLNGWAKGADTLPAGAKFIGGFNDLFTPGQDFKPLGLSRKIGIISQTTKIPSEFADFVTTLINRNIERLDEVRVINTICPIVTQRIEDTRKLANEVDAMLVVGSKESANTMNLARVASGAMGIKPVLQVLREGDIGAALVEAFQATDWGNIRIGVTAGTSTPIDVVKKVVEVVEKVSSRVEERMYGNNHSD